jgi:hypothetical protein
MHHTVYDTNGYGNTVRSFSAQRTTVRSPRKLDYRLTLWHPINSTFGLLGSRFGREVALNGYFPFHCLPSLNLSL